MITGFIREKFPKWAMVLLTIFCNASAVYRVLCFVDDCIAKADKKRVLALVCGILCCTPCLIVFWVVDLITVITKGEITWLVK